MAPVSHDSWRVHRGLSFAPDATAWLTGDMPSASDHPTLVFDGDCGFCTTVAKHFEKRSRVPINIAAWQLTDLERLGLTAEQASAQVYLASDGVLFGGHEAFAEFMRLQGDPFHRAVAGLMRAPGIRRVSAWGYRLVAKNRHHLPDGTPACEMPR
jgi:predicted DCC family thiol-disulfide oxidoreductase YuxK